MVAFSILMQALGLNGTVQSNHRKGRGFSCKTISEPNKIMNLYPSFLLSVYKLIYDVKHRIRIIIRQLIYS